VSEQPTILDRYYQRDAIGACLGGWDKFDSGVLSLTTGAGKTYVAARVIQKLVAKGKRVLFQADQNELIIQPLKSLQRFAGIIAAVEQAKDRASLNAKVVVASAQTLIRKARRERFPADHFDYIIQDEAHRGSDRNQEISKYFAGAKTLGMTATPFRAGLQSLAKYFQTVFYDKPMASMPGKRNPGMIDEGFAPAIKQVTLPIEIDLEQVKVAMTPEGKDYKPEDCSTAIEPYYEAIAKIIADRFKRRHIICYLPLIKSSQAFASILRRHGVTALHVDGQSPDREEIIERFSRGEFCCLCNAGVISIGVDIPIADAMLNLQPMHSPALYQQRAGRVARVLPGVVDDLPEQNQSNERKERIAWSDKPVFEIFDVLWQHDRLGVMRPESLVCDNPEDAARMFARRRTDMTAEDLQELHKRVQEDKEHQLIQAIERAALKSGTRKGVAASEAGVLFGNARLSDYVPVARWEMEKPSEAQLAALCRSGIDIASVASKGQAKALMDEVIFRATHNLATTRQLRYIYRINAERAPEAKVPHPERLNFTEASAVIEAEVGRRNAEQLQREFSHV
jgi:superfamily II DNA or RNA helicase